MSQLSFDFDAPVVLKPNREQLKREAAQRAEDDAARNRKFWAKMSAEARAYWKVGMVTSLPIFATVLDSDQRYTQMLPGVVESITGDTATVRIYAAPEYGYTLANYPLHKKLAIDVALSDLGVHHGNQHLEDIVERGLLETGDPEVAAAIAGRVANWSAP